MKSKKINSKLFLKKEIISKLEMSDIIGKGVPTEYNNKSEMLNTTTAPTTANVADVSGGCQEVCWNLGTRGLCTDELATC